MLGSRVGYETFGADRYLNQYFYKDPAWRSIRNKVIVRDLGCDLGVIGHDIGIVRDLNGNVIDSDTCPIIVHHMNPITLDDIYNRNPDILDPQYLITCSDLTHKAIHYANESYAMTHNYSGRQPGDTNLWR